MVVPTAMTRRRFFFGVVHGPRGRLADEEPLLVHDMFGNLFGLHGREGSRPHMQCDETNLNSERADFVEQRGGKMQAGCRRGHGSGRVRVHGLITLQIIREQIGCGPPDVGRERRFTQ